MQMRVLMGAQSDYTFGRSADGTVESATYSADVERLRSDAAWAHFMGSTGTPIKPKDAPGRHGAASGNGNGGEYQSVDADTLARAIRKTAEAALALRK